MNPSVRINESGLHRRQGDFYRSGAFLKRSPFHQWTKSYGEHAFGIPLDTDGDLVEYNKRDPRSLTDAANSILKILSHILSW